MSGWAVMAPAMMAAVAWNGPCHPREMTILAAALTLSTAFGQDSLSGAPEKVLNSRFAQV